MNSIMAWNDLFLGLFDPVSRKREGGLYYMSERALSGHNSKSLLCMSLLIHSAKEGTKIDNREAEQAFLLRSGKELCDVLRLDYYSVIEGIQLVWERIDASTKN